jgi:hypothetical protein
MSELNRNEIPGPIPDRVLDAIHLREICERLRIVLASADRELSLIRRDIDSLPAEPGLPPEYRDAYRRIVALLIAAENALKESAEKSENLQEAFYDFGILRCSEMSSAPPALIATARRNVESINAAEIRIRHAIRSAREALLAHADLAVVDWTMPFEVTFTVLLRPSPRRQFYETCADDEPLEITVQYPLSLWRRDDESDTTDWNICSIWPDCPLIGDHHGYLVHCLLDHNAFPWQALAHIREIGVKVSFNDWETAWPVETAPQNGPQWLPLKQHVGSKFSFCRVPLSIQAHGFDISSPLPAPRKDRAGLATCVKWRRARKGGNLANPTRRTPC